jgi:hypothetical protein
LKILLTNLCSLLGEPDTSKSLGNKDVAKEGK